MKKINLILSLLIFNFFCYSQVDDFKNIEYLRINSSNKNNISGIINKSAKMRIGVSPLDKIIYTFTKKDTVELIDFHSGYWGVKYKEQIGYVSELFVIENEEIKDFKKTKKTDWHFKKQILLEINSLENKVIELKKSLKDTIKQIERKKISLQQEIIGKRLENFENLSIENQWNLLVQIGGCLGGGQYCRNGKCEDDDCVMSNSKYWNYFLGQSKLEIVDFLIINIADTTKTKVHTCPFSMAKEGEVAIYALQYIFKTNWDDLSPDYKKYRETEITGFKTSYQSFIWEIIKNDDELKKMQENWKKMK